MCENKRKRRVILIFDKEFVFPNNLYHNSEQRCCKWHCMCSTCLLMVHVLSKVSFPPYPPIMWDRLSCIFATERLKYDVTRNTRSTKSNDILNTLETYLVNLRACLNYFHISKIVWNLIPNHKIWRKMYCARIYHTFFSILYRCIS